MSKEYLVVKMNFSDDPKIFAKLFTEKSHWPLTISGKLQGYTDYKDGMQAILTHFGNDYLTKEFTDTLELKNNGVSVEIRGHPNKVLPIATYMSLKMGNLTKEELDKYLKK